MIRKFGADTVLMTLGIMVNKIAIMAITIMLARSSTTEVYGVFALLRNTVNMVETTLSSSVTPIVIRLSGNEHGKQEAFAQTNTLLLLMSLGLVVAISIPLWFLAEPIAVAIFDSANPEYIHFGLLLLVATNASGAVASLLVTGRATSYLPLASFIAAPVGIIFALIYLPEAPLLAAVTAMILVHAVEFAIKLGLAIRKKIVALRLGGSLPKGIVGIFRTSLTILILSSAINAVAFWVLRLILVDNADAFTPLAQFDVAFQYLAVEMMVINNAVTLFQSRSAKVAELDPDEASRIFRAGIQLTALIAAGACATNLFFAELLIGLYGEGYDPQLLRVLTAVLPFYAAAVFLNRMYVNQGRPSILLLVSSISSAAALIYAFGWMQSAYQLAFAFVIYFAVSDIIYLGCLAWLRRYSASA